MQKCPIILHGERGEPMDIDVEKDGYVIKGTYRLEYPYSIFMLVILFTITIVSIYDALVGKYWLHWLVAAIMFCILILFMVYAYCLGRSYELNHSGFTVITPLNSRHFYSWEEYPYIYVFSKIEVNDFWSKYFMFSRTPIDVETANRMQRLWMNFHPNLLFLFQYSESIEKEMREKLPKLKIEYCGKQGSPGHFRKPKGID